MRDPRPSAPPVRATDARVRAARSAGRRRGIATGAVLGAGALLAGPVAAGAPAAERLVVNGAGFGHGVGLSQYGAAGMAAKGFSVRRILAHYYRGTSLQRSGAADRRVRVALQTGVRETTISGAKSIGGITTKTTRSYRLIRTSSGIEIRQIGRKKKVGSSGGGIEVVPANAGVLRVAGRSADGVQGGSYRGTIDVLPDGGDLVVVNELPMDDYLRGVVTEESPSNFPTAALQAQAIVARTYAITNAVGGRPFDQWPDTRSQVYTGIAGETAEGNAAVDATSGQVVTLNGTPVITYFFSTSGGRTEDSSNVFGGEERSWLQSVPDPYEGDVALHRWTRTFSARSADARTARFGVGDLRRIDVLERGDSPRVVRARVTGTTGTKDIDGGQLQRAFALPDRWATFALVSMSGCLKAGPTAAQVRFARDQAAARAVRAELRRRARDPQSTAAGEGIGLAVSGAAPLDGSDGGRPAPTTPAAPTLPGVTTTPGAPSPPGGDAPDAGAGPAEQAIAVAGDGAADIGALLTAQDPSATRAIRAKAPKVAPRCRLVGGVRPAPRGAAGRLQRQDGDRWTTVRRVALKDGRFETVVPKKGSWRVRVGSFSTPVAGL
ncbi:SpoIID/LytB domain-containing protein [Patulibacter minatonensis]|uniref:SpoIID/LytB domain-containing protein n=1 Tax=Patulibacter minatonensis TaxID=298163 RepID=UPI00047EC3A7|nr:SpoIID/LytB domain-containing protein [Patulibacter minatonensis]